MVTIWTACDHAHDRPVFHWEWSKPLNWFSRHRRVSFLSGFLLDFFRPSRPIRCGRLATQSHFPVDVGKLRYSSWKKWQSRVVWRLTKWRRRHRSRTEENARQIRCFCTANLFWIRSPHFLYLLPCPLFHYRRMSGHLGKQIIANTSNSELHALSFCHLLSGRWLLHHLAAALWPPSGWFFSKGSIRLEF